MNEKELKQERRKRYLNGLIKEGILNVMAEQEIAGQQPGISSVPPASQMPSPETNVMDPGAQPPPDPVVDEQFTVDSMVEKLNVLRGGKSYTDPEIYGSLTTFFKNLTEEQRVSLEWVLTELNKIVVDVDVDPGEQPPTDPTTAQPVPPPPPAAAPPAAPAPAAPVSVS